jgi:hypothetical protein
LRLPRGVLFQGRNQILKTEVCFHKRKAVSDDSVCHLPDLLIYLALFVKQPRKVPFGAKLAKMNRYGLSDVFVEGVGGSTAPPTAPAVDCERPPLD